MKEHTISNHSVGLFPAIAKFLQFHAAKVHVPWGCSVVKIQAKPNPILYPLPSTTRNRHYCVGAIAGTTWRLFYYKWLLQKHAVLARTEKMVLRSPTPCHELLKRLANIGKVLHFDHMLWDAEKCSTWLTLLKSLHPLLIEVLLLSLYFRDDGCDCLIDDAQHTSKVLIKCHRLSANKCLMSH